jgi:membrane protein implicated in regulation of membrane protease activity
MNTKTRNRLLLLSLILVLAALITLILGNFARESIAIPIYRFLWVSTLIFNSIPQALFWALFIAVALFLAARSVFKREKPTRKTPAPDMTYLKRVHVLTRWIQYAAHGTYFRQRLAKHLGELTVEILARRERLTREQIRQKLRDGDWDAPPEVRAYIQAGLSPASLLSTNLLSRLTGRLRPGGHSSPFNLHPETIVQFLEEQLEVQHGNRNR